MSVLCCYSNCHRLGAAIVVATGTVLPVFARNYYNPLCFIQYPFSDIPPVDWTKVEADTYCIIIVIIILYRFFSSSVAIKPSLDLPYMPIFLTCVPGTHSIPHTSMSTEAVFCVGLLFLMGMDLCFI